jgi:argininosuccinate lyase
MVAGVVRHAEKASTTLREALERSPQALRPLEFDEALALLDPAAAVERRATPGGPSRRSVRAQITAHRRALKADRQRHGVLAGRLPDRRSAAGG